jgi:putative lipoprotein (rSAM/lipoprotein system)
MNTKQILAQTKKYFLKGINFIISGILLALGFSCDTTGGGLAEYGCPYADFIINGDVKSAETDSPVKNIKVIVKYNDSLAWTIDSVHTNTDGLFSIASERYNIPFDTVSYRFIFEDIDGAQNGLFKKLDTIIKFEDIEYTDGDNNWYVGHAERNISIKLKPDNDSK